MNATRKNVDTSRKRKPDDRDKLARKRQEDALDDALQNTFPASDPVSIEQPAPPDANDGKSMHPVPQRGCFLDLGSDGRVLSVRDVERK